MPARSSSRSHARILAPLAIVACALAVLVVIGSSLGGGGSTGGSAGNRADNTADRQSTGPATTSPQPRRPANYTIQSGDTLGAIAEENGVSVDRLQELNPGLDPQALIAGQKIKLR